MLDYKAAGLVTLTSGENGQPDIIRHGETGWIVPPCDEDALAQAIVALCANPQLRRKMGQNARIEAEKFTVGGMWRKSWKRYLSELILAVTTEVHFCALKSVP